MEGRVLLGRGGDHEGGQERRLRKLEGGQVEGLGGMGCGEKGPYCTPFPGGICQISVCLVVGSNMTKHCQWAEIRACFKSSKTVRAFSSSFEEALPNFSSNFVDFRMSVRGWAISANLWTNFLEKPANPRKASTSCTVL
jgi:hypothetical protein